jgi:diketogulonate reductase-like aldo/keto reductase
MLSLDAVNTVVAFALLVVSSSMGVPDIAIAPNVSMPMLAFGTMTISNEGCTVQGAVEQWLRLGGRHIDMSLLYKTQPDAGRGINASGVPRKELFLTTKVEGPIGYKEAIDQVTNTDLAQVGVDYFDLVLIHFPCPSFKDFPNKCGSKFKQERLETWRGLEQLKRTGKVRAIGVSNYNQEQLRELIDAGYRPAVNQLQWHLGYHNDTFLQEMTDLGVKMEAWASLAGPTKSHNIPGVSLGDARLKAVAKRYNASTAQVALQWSVRKGVTPVTATCVLEHAKGDLTAFDFNLSAEDISYLDSLKEESLPAIFT